MYLQGKTEKKNHKKLHVANVTRMYLQVKTEKKIIKSYM